MLAAVQHDRLLLCCTSKARFVQILDALHVDWLYSDNPVPETTRGSRAAVRSGPVGRARPFRAAFVAGFRVMTAKPLLMMILATLLGPVIGVGLFILMHTL